MSMQSPPLTNQRLIDRFALGIALLVVGTLVVIQVNAQQKPVAPTTIRSTFPGLDWQANTRITQNWDENQLMQLRSYVIDSCNTTGLLIIQQGRIVFQYGNVTDNSYLASCRKSVLAMLYGPFVENGTIRLDETIQQLHINDVGGLLPIEQKATIRQLLTARSGVYHKASNEGDASAMAPPRGTVQPGSFWLYNNWDFNVAGYILEKKTGKTIYDLVDSLLAKPLQMQDWQRGIQRKVGDSTRSIYPAYHLWFSTRDMARLGLLMLNQGSWNGRQVLSAAWVNRITSVVTPYQEALVHKTNYYDFGYGYLWWIWDAPTINPKLTGAYTASGAFGQFITVIPQLNLVIAHKTNYDDYRRNTPTDKYLRIVEKIVHASLTP